MASGNPTIISGGAATGGPRGELTDRFKPETADMIFNYGPNVNPLTIWSRAQSKKSLINQSFKVLEDEPLPRTTRVNNGAGYTAGNTAITVDNGSYFRPQEQVKVPRTGEVMLVKSIAGNVITVVRAYGTTAAAALVDNDQLVLMGLSQSERSVVPAAKTTKVAARTNYAE